MWPPLQQLPMVSHHNQSANLLCQPPIEWLVVLQPPLFLADSSITCAQGCVLNVASAPCPFSALARPTDSLGSGVCWPPLIFLSEAAHILTLYPFALALLFVIHIAIQDLYLYSCSYQICSVQHSYQYSTVVMTTYDTAKFPGCRKHMTSGNLLCHSVISSVKQIPQRYFEDFEDLMDQFGSVTQSCPTLCDPMDYGTPRFPVYHQLPEFAHTHVHWVCDAIQSSHPLSSPSPPALKLSEHQGLFQWVSSLHQVAKVLEFQLQYQSFQWTSRTDLL